MGIRAQRLKQWFADLAESVNKLLVGFVGLMVLTGSYLWFIRYVSGEGESPFVLAQVSTALGGFLLVGLFLKRGPENKATSVRPQLLWIARMSIIAAVAFVAVGLLLPSSSSVEPEPLGFDLIRWFTLASFVVASLAFTGAVTLLLLTLPRLKA